MIGASLDDPEAGSRALFSVSSETREAQRNFWARVHPTEYGRGPWDHGLLHGGPVGGLAAWGAEQLVAPEENLFCSRVTLEMLSGVPMVELEVNSTIVKAGRRSKVVDVTITSSSRIVARASSQWVVRSTGWTTPLEPAPERPAQAENPGAETDIDYPRPGFNCDAAELRYLNGSNEASGPSTIWTRLTSPLIVDQRPSPLVALAIVADFSAAAGWEIDPSSDDHYINPDLTLQIHRYPETDWVAIAATNRRTAGTAGFNDAVLFDEQSMIGRVTQSLVPSPIQIEI